VNGELLRMSSREIKALADEGVIWPTLPHTDDYANIACVGDIGARDSPAQVTPPNELLYRGGRVADDLWQFASFIRRYQPRVAWCRC
jgi:hypothetical protein